MTTKLRSGKIIDKNIDELSGLFSKTMKLTTPRTINKTKKSDEDMLSNIFGQLTIGKSISKTRKKKGSRFTHKKKYRKVGEMDLRGGGRSRRRKYNKY
jgi:hypothetical protein